MRERESIRREPREKVMSIRKCPRCGRSLDGDIVIDGLCFDCFFSLNDPVDQLTRHARLAYCPLCGKIKIGHHWKHYSDPNELSSYMERRLSKVFERIPVSPSNVSMKLIVTPVIEENKARVQLLLSSKVRTYRRTWLLEDVFTREICPDCIRRKIGYHKAIVQVRTEGITKEELTGILGDLIDERIYSSMVEINETQNGVDIKFLEQAAARMLASRLASTLPADVKESFKLISNKGGDKIGRLSISIRLYGKEQWTLGEINGDPVLFRKTRQGKIAVKKLDEADRTILWDSSVLRQLRPFRQDFRIVRVISSSESSYYAIDESNYTDFYEIPRNKAIGKLEKGEEAVLVYTKRGEYIIPRRLLREI